MDNNDISDSDDSEYESENDVDDSYDPGMDIQIIGFASYSSINFYIYIHNSMWTLCVCLSVCLSVCPGTSPRQI